tara:strand:+ start:1457 stop:3700 length:2244 start_codon:yes stop_codon:yes gene_type:complete
MKNNWNIRSIISFIKAFFPFQLLTLQLKLNLFALLFWVLLFLIVSNSVGVTFGIPLLFLSPEYLGEINPISFLLLGIALGGFTTAFNTFSYIKLGPQFPFLTNVNKPFYKFYINNSIIPLVFIIYYTIQIYIFQTQKELIDVKLTLFNIFTFYSGFCLFLLVSFLFFFKVHNRKKTTSQLDESNTKPITSFLHKKVKWHNYFKSDEEKISIYLGKKLRLKKSRSLKHFDQNLVEKIFAKNKISSSLFEILTISIFLILGAFSSYQAFNVPAAVSFFILLTIILMLFSALNSWFKGWSYPLILIIFFSMDFISSRTEYFKYTNYAYGLNYTKETKDLYNISQFKAITNDRSSNKASLVQFTHTLENWKTKTGETKPKLIIINSSGGGSRSALWNTTVLQNCDSIIPHKFTSHIQLMTGASGGMIGAAYFRELILREKYNQNFSISRSDSKINIGKDLLNQMTFVASTNDLFFRYKNFKYHNLEYPKDRGTAFEDQLHNNTNGVLKHSLGYYAKYETNGTIPTMIFTPTIANDGRRLLICSQPLNFLTTPAHKRKEFPCAFENIDIYALLKSQNSGNLRFSSVLRMNATFPFVMPMVSLPTSPEVQIMDAGIRDNYGGILTSEFIFNMQDWLRENTSGIIIIQIRDTKNVLENEKHQSTSLFDKLSLPFGNMYKNFPRVQDFQQEKLLNIGFQTFDFPVDIVSFNLREKADDKISLSWHLTQKEKNKIEVAFNSKQNKAALQQLKTLLK